MKICRYKINDSIYYGALIIKNDKKYINRLQNDIFSNNEIVKTNIYEEIDNILFLPPCEPTKIVCLAINYKGITNYSKDRPEPVTFLKSYNSLCIHGDPISIPFNDLNSWGEAELGIVIKKKITKTTSNKKSNILGYVLANDITTQNIYNRDHHLARSKSSDRYCPISKYIDTSFNPKDQQIEFFHNETLLRSGKISDMIMSIDKILTFISSWMTIYPGDIILTGSPPRVQDRIYIKEGDVLTCKCEGLDDLENNIDSK